MKKLLLLLLALPLFASSQDAAILKFPEQDGKIVYEEIIEMSGKSKSQIYGASKKWVVQTFNYPKAAIQDTHEDTGQLLGSGLKDISFKSRLITLMYSFDIAVRDNKTRIRILDLKYTVPYLSATQTPLENLKLKQPVQEALITTVNAHCYELIESYKKSVAKTLNDDF